jgi:transcriptional regulator with XRE-family HTH domain
MIKRKPTATGDLVKLMRVVKKLSRKQVALKCVRSGTPVHVNTIYRLESGTGSVGINKLLAICDVLGIAFTAVSTSKVDRRKP